MVLTGETEVLREKVSQRHSVHHKRHSTVAIRKYR